LRARQVHVFTSASLNGSCWNMRLRATSWSLELKDFSRCHQRVKISKRQRKEFEDGESGPARAEISRAPLCLLKEPDWGKGSKQAHRDMAEKNSEQRDCRKCRLRSNRNPWSPNYLARTREVVERTERIVTKENIVSVNETNGLPRATRDLQ